MKLHLEKTGRGVSDPDDLAYDEAVHLLDIVASIGTLTRDDGDTLMIFADLPRWKDEAGRVKILVAGDWVNGPDRAMEFYGPTLQAALQKGVEMRRAMERPHWKPKPKPRTP